MSDHADTIRRYVEKGPRVVLPRDEPTREQALAALDALLAERQQWKDRYEAAARAEDEERAERLQLQREAYDVALILDQVRAERQQAIEALREIARGIFSADQQARQAIAREALAKLGEQPK